MHMSVIVSKIKPLGIKKFLIAYKLFKAVFTFNIVNRRNMENSPISLTFY